MTFFDSHRVFRRALLACLLSVTGTGVPVWAEEPVPTGSPEKERSVALTVQGISVQADDDYPRVLNILPWQPPTVSRRNRDPLRLDDAGLLEPADPYAMRRHRQFRETLDPLSEPAAE